MASVASFLAFAISVHLFRKPVIWFLRVKGVKGLCLYKMLRQFSGICGLKGQG